MSTTIMFNVLIILALLPFTISVTCRTYSPQEEKGPENMKSLYCAFYMTERCHKGHYSEGPAWGAQPMPNQCSIKNQMFSCSCNTDFCSSDHNYLMKLWKKSSKYSKNSKYTACLQKIIDEDLEKDDNAAWMGESEEEFEVESQKIQGAISDDEDDRDDIEAEDLRLKQRKKLTPGYLSAVNLAVALIVFVF
ncbi:unnamed protein product [Cylicocyclus nassatus]|uniref:Uncharacterized protein n=1 Tax=Cylicocyclus nassatus TaxID=53992 RepID=A0AA36GDN8_CYLNA|nr:unnamed protein product [Cylicocyclus nassatus]